MNVVFLSVMGMSGINRASVNPHFHFFSMLTRIEKDFELTLEFAVVVRCLIVILSCLSPHYSL